jgi:hypothetical protein
VERVLGLATLSLIFPSGETWATSRTTRNVCALFFGSTRTFIQQDAQWREKFPKDSRLAQALPLHSMAHICLFPHSQERPGTTKMGGS